MIIECINCNKKFKVDSELIPAEGRTIQCGACNHTWFFNKKDQISSVNDNKQNLENKKNTKLENINKKKIIPKTLNEISKNINEISSKKSELIKYQKKNKLNFSKFLSYILVFIISFIALIIVLDTFKSQLYVFFPNIEFFLFSFFETLKDIQLFLTDLVHND